MTRNGSSSSRWDAPLGLDFAHERRRQLQALTAWNAWRGHRRMPLLDEASLEPHACESESAFFLRAPDGPVCAVRDDRGIPADLARGIRVNWHAVAAATVPLQFSLGSGSDRAWRGILLPFASHEGRVGAVKVVARMALAPGGSDLRSVAAAVDSAVGASGPVPASPWTSGTGADTLLGERRAGSRSVHAQLSAARTWAELASRGPVPARASAERAALASAFELSLAVRADPCATRSLGLTGSDAACTRQIVALVFDRDAQGPQRRDMAHALAHGARLGLDRTGFAALLARCPGGYRGLGAAERLARSTAQGRTTIGPDQSVRGELLLEPFRPSILRQGFRSALKPADTPERAVA